MGACAECGGGNTVRMGPAGFKPLSKKAERAEGAHAFNNTDENNDTYRPGSITHGVAEKRPGGMRWAKRRTSRH